VHSVEPGDDYLIALPASRQAMLVSGDKHLLALADHIPVLAPAEFVKQVAERPDLPE
jgi:predicted nucleic acid-binding protein